MSNQFNPDYTIHPGEYIEEILEARNMKKHDFAQRCGISVKAVSQIINCKSLFSSDLALQFERVLGVDADLLMNLLTNYQMYETRLKDREELETKENWIKKFPEKELVEYEIIPKSSHVSEKANNLLDFFNVSSPEVWEDYYSKKAVSFRESPKFNFSLESTATWLRIGEKLSESIECGKYDKDKFKSALKEIRKLTTVDPCKFSNEMVEICRKCGVAVVFVPELKKTHISGASQWISSEKALIIMSLRYKTNDHFWFTFFHEAGHILLHGKKEVFIDSNDNTYSENEIEADKFSRKMLIDENLYKVFLEKGEFYKSDIQKFAKKNNIAAGIVVGMLQHDKKIKYSWHNDLKKKLEIIKED